MKKYKIAVVGATGVVGQMMRKVLEEKKLVTISAKNKLRLAALIFKEKASTCKSTPPVFI